MNYRHALIYPPTDLTNGAGTLTLDIDIDKPISRINIRFKTSRLINSMDAPAPANIPKIELVDGSRVLHSLTGYENQALAYYNRPNIAMEHGQHVANLSEVDYYALDFGRYLWDELLAFLADRFTNPQLKITYDENVADTTCSENEIEVWADIFDEKVINPLGFLMPIEHFAYTPGTSGSYETISLPEDRPIRQILVRAHMDGREPWYNISEARFDEGTLDRIPWEYTSLEYYFRRMQAVWPMIRTPFQAVPNTAGRTYYIPQSEYWASLNLLPASAAATYYEAGTGAAGGKISLKGAEVQAIGEALGYLPWSCFQFPLGKQDVIEDWYDPAGKKPRLRLRAFTGAGNSTAQVVLEELYKY